MPAVTLLKKEGKPKKEDKQEAQEINLLLHI